MTEEKRKKLRLWIFLKVLVGLFLFGISQLITNYTNVFNKEGSLLMLQVVAGVLAFLGILCLLSAYYSRKKMQKKEM